MRKRRSIPRGRPHSVVRALVSRALGELQVAGSGGSGKRRAATNIFEGATYNINNPVVPDSGAAYHLTDILKRELDPYIEERVKRMIG